MPCTGFGTMLYTDPGVDRLILDSKQETGGFSACMYRAYPTEYIEYIAVNTIPLEYLYSYALIIHFALWQIKNEWTNGKIAFAKMCAKF